MKSTNVPKKKGHAGTRGPWPRSNALWNMGQLWELIEKRDSKLHAISEVGGQSSGDTMPDMPPYGLLASVLQALGLYED